ncbi:hypothetical protein ASD92_10170 [Massilia sp. Root1485]|nr:hypothetical protein ASD92_10170 [Massilia sp. Root1485]
MSSPNRREIFRRIRLFLELDFKTANFQGSRRIFRFYLIAVAIHRPHLITTVIHLDALYGPTVFFGLLPQRITWLPLVNRVRTVDMGRRLITADQSSQHDENWK